MARRPNWKGYLKLSLVSCPIALYSATSTSERIRFHIINRKTGNRVHNEIVDAETGDPVEDEDRIKGFEVRKGEHILLEDEEFDNVALESTHTIDIESFIPRSEVDEIYLDESYYIVPTGGDVGAEAFTVIREAMKKEDVVGLARVVLYRRERLLMLQPRERGLMATAVRYRKEVRDADEYFSEIAKEKIPRDMLELATHIVKTKISHFDPDRFQDRYEKALGDLIKAKAAGKAPAKAAESRPDNVINLMDALRRSVQSGKGGGKQTAHRTAKARKRAPKRRVKKAS